jgi:hypothetical protein
MGETNYRTENLTRLMKSTSLDGEYLLLGRKVPNTGNIFIQFGQRPTRTLNTTGGVGVEGEWIDGLQLSIQTEEDAQINIDVRQPFTTTALAPEFEALGTTS